MSGRLIPFYSYDGAYLDHIAIKRAERLEQLGRAKVIRHRKGHVRRDPHRPIVTGSKPGAFAVNSRIAPAANIVMQSEWRAVSKRWGNRIVRRIQFEIAAPHAADTAAMA